MKNKDVCIGCKYHVKTCTKVVFKNICDYAEMTGKSRLVKEMQNGGYKEDSCICYEKGRRKNRIVTPTVYKRGKKK